MGNKANPVYVDARFTNSLGNVKLTGGSIIKCDNYRNGTDNPKYASIIKDGKDATTQLTAQMQQLIVKWGGARGEYNGNQTYKSQSVGINPVLPAVPSDVHPGYNSVRARVRARAFSKLNELQNGTSFSSQIALGELRETVDLLRNPLAKSQALLAALVSGKRLGRSAAESWLEFRFGILPLLGDIKAISDLMSDVSKEGKHSKYRFYDKLEYSATVVDTIGNDGTQVLYHIRQKDTLTFEGFIHMGLSALPDNIASGVDILTSNLSDLSEIPSTAWELIPYSFLVDYFVNVGDIIAAATTGKQLLSYTSESVVSTATKEGLSLGFRSYDSALYKKMEYLSPASYKSSTRRVIRKTGGLAIPPITLSLPGSNIKLLNIAALLALKL